MPMSSSAGGNAVLPPKVVNVLFNSITKSFTYSGDIDSKTEEITVFGVGTANINFLLEGATWATVPIKWVNGQKQPATEPSCMTVNVIGSKQLIIEDCCEALSSGTYAFLVCVNDNGTVVCSDPRILNDPAGP